MLLAMKERIFATIINEQRKLFVCGHVPPMIAWLFAADQCESKRQSPFRGDAPTMRLLRSSIHWSLLPTSAWLQKNCYRATVERRR